MKDYAYDDNTINRDTKPSTICTHQHIEFQVDDLVMVYFPVAKVGMTYKFLAKWNGPFKIIRKLSNVNYRIASLKGDKILVVHVQRMLRYKPWNFKK